MVPSRVHGRAIVVRGLVQFCRQIKSSNNTSCYTVYTSLCAPDRHTDSSRLCYTVNTPLEVGATRVFCPVRPIMMCTRCVTLPRCAGLSSATSSRAPPRTRSPQPPQTNGLAHLLLIHPARISVESKARAARPASAAIAADGPRWAEARGSLAHDLAPKEASGEPAGRGLKEASVAPSWRGLSHLAFDTGPTSCSAARRMAACRPSSATTGSSA